MKNTSIAWAPRLMSGWVIRSPNAEAKRVANRMCKSLTETSLNGTPKSMPWIEPKVSSTALRTRDASFRAES